MKLIIILMVLFLNGCTFEAIEMPATKVEKNPFPDLMTRPGKETRRDIMSGKKPDWDADRRGGRLEIGW